MHLTDKAGLKFISDDLVRDVYKSPEIVQVRYKTKYDIKRKNKTPVFFPKIFFHANFRIFISNFRSNAGWRMVQSLHHPKSNELNQELNRRRIKTILKGPPIYRKWESNFLKLRLKRLSSTISNNLFQSLLLKVRSKSIKGSWISSFKMNHFLCVAVRWELPRLIQISNLISTYYCIDYHGIKELKTSNVFWTFARAM